MKVAMIGDNCIDVYSNLNRYYETGNVVDTGVNLQMLGANVSMITTTGSDKYGDKIIALLQKVGIDTSHTKVADGPTAITFMDMNGNDRVHGDYVEGVLENMVFDEEDIRFASTHDLVHSALWGKADNILKDVKVLKNTKISFDYADRLDSPIIDSTIKYVDYGFFSYHGVRDEFIENFLKDKVDRGMSIAIATFGENGSLAYDGNKYYQCGIYPTTVVNTVGAGDAFISGFIYELLKGSSIDVCLDSGAKLSSKIIAVFEPWII